MLIDLRVEGRRVLILGGGSVGERKARKFLQENSQVIVVSRSFTEELESLGRRGRVKLIRSGIEPDSPLIGSLISESFVVVAATDDRRLNEEIAAKAKEQGALLSVVDEPSLSDFYMPATTRLGEIRVAICTGGRSPAVSRILRERIERLITREDILQVELQDYARRLVKSRVPDREARRRIIYRIIHDPEIKHLLREGNFEEAKSLAKRIIEHQ
ncbi:MAG: Siroheme synthase [Candidatus Bathyarchaeota archaeon B63]|nr:MAG: Siroheme synthase [Candidatus Bathyarchaeota archaeon B63]